jgi:hypothetical protein
MSMTAQEQAELDSLRTQMKVISDRVKAARLARPASPLMADVLKLRAMTPELVTDADLAAFQWLDADREDRAEFDKLVARHNEIVTQINARIRDKKIARQAAKERAQVRAAMCSECFTVHSGECL